MQPDKVVSAAAAPESSLEVLDGLTYGGRPLPREYTHVATTASLCLPRAPFILVALTGNLPSPAFSLSCSLVSVAV